MADNTTPRRSDPRRGEPVEQSGPSGQYVTRAVTTILAAGATDVVGYQPPVHGAPTDRLYPDAGRQG